jgi:hypothetical protein
VPRSSLDDAFAHHVWATNKVIDACAELSPEQLATPMPGTYGSVLDTVRHTVGADAWYLFVITGGRVPLPRGWRRDSLPFARKKASTRETRSVPPPRPATGTRRKRSDFVVTQSSVETESSSSTTGVRPAVRSLLPDG